ncbi:hypothetical protein HHI36_005796, partial [Cryptolaemus montrouzieri]
SEESGEPSLTESHSSLQNSSENSPWLLKRRRASTFHTGDTRDEQPTPLWLRKKGVSLHDIQRYGNMEEDDDENKR